MNLSQIGIRLRSVLTGVNRPTLATNGNRDNAHPDLRLTAYAVQGNRMELVAASPNRSWMNATAQSFANRCLPMRLANQNGWFILNNQGIEVLWNGGSQTSDLKIRYLSPPTELPEGKPSVLSHFGYGLLTWRVPFVFRTPPGYNLYVRGPANWGKDGACPLDGIVETDWAVTTFTMNWKITRLNTPIRFEQGDPISMVFPILRSQVEEFVPELRDIQSEPILEREYQAWAGSRWTFLGQPRDPKIWQRHYFEGIHPSTPDKFASHQTRLNVRPFTDYRGRQAAEPSSPKSLCRAVPDLASSCPVNKTLDLSNTASKHVLEDNFFHAAEEIRSHLDTQVLTQSASTRPNTRRIWEYRANGREAPHFSASLNVLPERLTIAFRERLHAWADARARTYTTLLAQILMFVNGSALDLTAPISESRNGLRFFLALTRRETRSFKGGQILLPTNDLGKRRSVFHSDLISLNFNQFLAADISQPFGIRSVRTRVEPMILLIGEMV